QRLPHRRDHLAVVLLQVARGVEGLTRVEADLPPLQLRRPGEELAEQVRTPGVPVVAAAPLRQHGARRAAARGAADLAQVAVLLAQGRGEDLVLVLEAGELAVADPALLQRVGDIAVDLPGPQRPLALLAADD